MVTKLLSLLFGSNDDNAPAKPTVSKASAGRKPVNGEANLEGFVEYVVKSLVTHIKDVKVTSETDDQGLLIRIRCHQDEVGRVIGKSGKTIRAIRSLVKGAAARQNQKASVIVMED